MKYNSVSIYIKCSSFHSQLGLILVTDPPTHDNDELVYSILTDHILQTARGEQPIPPLASQDFHQV